MGEKARQSIFGGVHNHLRSTIFDSLLASAVVQDYCITFRTETTFNKINYNWDQNALLTWHII